MSYCNQLPEKKKIENFNNEKSYMLLKSNNVNESSNTYNTHVNTIKDSCSFNLYSIVLALGFIVLLYFMWMKYSQ